MKPRTYPTPEWRFDELIDALKPYSRLVKRLEALGYPPVPVSTISNWRTVNSVPGVWAPALIELALADRVIDSIADLRRPRA